MNQIIISALCGAAFLGGALVVLVGVSWIVAYRDTKARQDMNDRWDKQLDAQEDQITVLDRIARCMERNESRQAIDSWAKPPKSTISGPLGAEIPGHRDDLPPQPGRRNG